MSRQVPHSLLHPLSPSSVHLPATQNSSLASQFTHSTPPAPQSSSQKTVWQYPPASLSQQPVQHSSSQHLPLTLLSVQAVVPSGSPVQAVPCF